MEFNIEKSREYVRGINLAGVPRFIREQDAAADAGAALDATKAQAQVVGSGLFSFAAGVTAEDREAISDSALLAQLVANKRVSAEDAPLEWFAAYSEVLQNVGWTLQENGWTDYSAGGNAVEVHEKVMEVMAAALGPSPAALAIIAAAVSALKAMDPASLWLRIFSRESQKTSMARFQVGLVEKEDSGDAMVELVACLVEARNTITQVLVFKFKDAHARFRANSTKVSINRAALSELRLVIRGKVRAYQADYVSNLLDV